MSSENVENHAIFSPHLLRCHSMMFRFPARLWKIINSCKTRAINWGPGGKTLRIFRTQFEDEYLKPDVKPFKTEHFSSFIRQLNLYGFKKVSAPMFMNEEKIEEYDDLYEYRHPLFRQNRPDLLPYLSRNCKSKDHRKKVTNDVSDAQKDDVICLQVGKSSVDQRPILAQVPLNGNKDLERVQSLNVKEHILKVDSAKRRRKKEKTNDGLDSSSRDVKLPMTPKQIEDHPLLQPVAKSTPTILQVNPRLQQPLAPHNTTKSFTYGSTIFVPVSQPNSQNIFNLQNSGRVVDSSSEPITLDIVKNKESSSCIENQPLKLEKEKNGELSNTQYEANTDTFMGVSLPIIHSIPIQTSIQDEMICTQMPNCKSPLDSFNTSLNLDSFVRDHINQVSFAESIKSPNSTSEVVENLIPMDIAGGHQDKNDLYYLNKSIEKHATLRQEHVPSQNTTEPPLKWTLEQTPKPLNNVAPDASSEERYISIDISNILPSDSSLDKPCHLIQLDSEILNLLRQGKLERSLNIFSIN